MSACVSLDLSDEISLFESTIFETKNEARAHCLGVEGPLFPGRLVPVDNLENDSDAIGYTALRAEANGEPEIMDDQLALTPSKEDAVHLADQSLSGGAMAVLPATLPLEVRFDVEEHPDVEIDTIDLTLETMRAENTAYARVAAVSRLYETTPRTYVETREVNPNWS